MSTLNEIIAQSNTSINKIIENGGELTEELALELENLNTALVNKVDNYAIFTDRIKNEITYFKSKAKEFSDVSKTLTSLDKNIKERIKFAMTELDKDELKGDNYRFKLSNTKAALEYDEAVLPDRYKIQTIVENVDKDMLRIDLENGLEVEGAFLKNSKSLRKYISKAGD